MCTVCGEMILVSLAVFLLVSQLRLLFFFFTVTSHGNEQK